MLCIKLFSGCKLVFVIILINKKSVEGRSMVYVDLLQVKEYESVGFDLVYDFGNMVVLV